MKTLYILVNDCGDGSCSLRCAFDSDLIREVEDAPDRYSYPAPGFDGDGFNYEELRVPDECTYESLGIPAWQVLSRDSFIEE